MTAPATRVTLRLGQGSRLILFWLLAATVLLTATGCQRASRTASVDQAPDIAAALAFDPDPATVGPASLTLTLQDVNGAPVAGATVSLKGDMSHAGMQPMLADAAETAAGVYKAAWVWTMSGDWFVTATAKLPDGRTLMRRFDLTVRRP